jgi:hypothetical protein
VHGIELHDSRDLRSGQFLSMMMNKIPDGGIRRGSVSLYQLEQLQYVIDQTPTDRKDSLDVEVPSNTFSSNSLSS